ncbi:MAG: SusC/RagA family TonB-linked outer membrane protein [Tidjanibacter sp.]|nr:SusC/RagA family TonB-linked outer membrane protein [Tidjanibacter sp.]
MRKIVLSIFAILMFCVSAVAQGQRITGTVSEESGAPVIGATVSVVGTTVATITDVNGQYEIKAAKDATLEFSYVGLATQNVAVAGRTTINVVMKADAHQMEELVVVGYGSGVAAKSLVGSVSSVKGDKVASTPVANVADVLQGKIPGLQVFTSSGEPTAGSTMMMRGVSSFNASTEPLIILDGTPVSSSVLNNLNSNDIESVVMLKDAASTAIYGSRAANGVMYVTTKKGTAAKSLVQVRMQGGFSAMIENKAFELMTGYEQMCFEEILYPDKTINGASAEEWAQKKAWVKRNDFNFDWKGYAYQSNAPVANIDASITGSSNGINYYISAGYLDTEGIAPRSGNTRYTFRTNVDAQAKPWLKVGANVNMSYSEYQTSVTGWYVQSVDGLVYGKATYLAPYPVKWTENGEFDGYDFEAGEVKYFLQENGFDSDVVNPYYYFKKFPTSNNTVRLSGNIYQEIKPFEGFTLKAVQAIDGSMSRGSSWRMPSYEDAEGSVLLNGQRSEGYSRYYQLTTTNTAEYKFSVDDVHNVVLLVGQESIVANSEGFGVSISGLTDDRLTMLSAGTSETLKLSSHSIVDEVYNSFFGRASYNYDGKYHIDASLRTDGSSKFGASNRWGTFWSLGGMWNVKTEEFMLAYDYINDLRLKASYGTTGNSGISNYLAYGLVASGPQYNGVGGTGIAQPSNEGLTWEVMKSFNIGFASRMFNRMSLDVEFYNRVTDNMLMEMPYSATTGYASGWGNVGKMRNRGVDVQFSYDLVQAANMLWTVYGNVSYNKNKILALYGETEDYVDGSTGLRYAVGHSVGEFTGVTSAGVDPRDGAPMWYDKDGNVTKVYSDSYEDWYGKSYVADWSGGFGTSLMLGNLQISADFSWVGERWMWLNEKFYTANLNFGSLGGTRYERRLLDIWQQPGDVTSIPKAGTEFHFDDTVYSNAAFLRLKNVTVSYNVPGSLFGEGAFIQGARVYAIGRNLWTLTNYLGFDPEYFRNGSQGTYPGTRQYTVGLELSF